LLLRPAAFGHPAPVRDIGLERLFVDEPFAVRPLCPDPPLLSKTTHMPRRQTAASRCFGSGDISPSSDEDLVGHNVNYGSRRPDDDGAGGSLRSGIILFFQKTVHKFLYRHFTG
jgi:hypothetical protein